MLLFLLLDGTRVIHEGYIHGNVKLFTMISRETPFLPRYTRDRSILENVFRKVSLGCEKYDTYNIHRRRPRAVGAVYFRDFSECSKINGDFDATVDYDGLSSLDWLLGSGRSSNAWKTALRSYSRSVSFLLWCLLCARYLMKQNGRWVRLYSAAPRPFSFLRCIL